jgi:cytochrome c553
LQEIVTMPSLSRMISVPVSAAGMALVLAAPGAAADAAAGRERAGVCRVCHGLDGVGTNPMVPNMGGQSELYLVKQLRDFRDGRREDPQMSIVLQGMSDAEIGDLAAWYASVVATYAIRE